MLIKRGQSLSALILTISIIAILILAGPANAIKVSLQVPDFQPADILKSFILDIEIKDGEFLPIINTKLTFDSGSEEVTCTIKNDDSVEGCDFLIVNSKEINNLNPGLGYGYGLKDDDPVSFGYGYGYGYGQRGAITGNPGGSIAYNLTINKTKLPADFIGKEIDVLAEVFGGSLDDTAVFTGNDKFKVEKAPEPPICLPVAEKKKICNEIFWKDRTICNHEYVDAIQECGVEHEEAVKACNDLATKSERIECRKNIPPISDCKEQVRLERDQCKEDAELERDSCVASCIP